MSPLPFAFITDTSRFEWLDVFAAWTVYFFFYIVASWFFPHPVLKAWWWVCTHTFWRIRVVGLENIPKTGGGILVCNHVSKIDWMYVYAACPRRVRVIVWSGYHRNPVWAYFLWWTRTIPIQARDPNATEALAGFRRVQRAVAAGDLVLFFAEGRLTRNGFLRPFHRGFELVARRTGAPIIPVYLANVWGSVFSYAHGKIIKKWPETFPRRVSVGFGKPLPPDTEAPVVRQHVQRVGAELTRVANHWGWPAHRTFVRRAARHPLRSCFVDPINKRELNFGKALAGVWVLRNWLKPRLGPERNIGLWIPTSTGGALANLACTFLGKVTVNLNYTAAAASVQSAIRQAGIRQVLSSKVFVRKVPFEVPSHEGPPEGDKVQIIYLEDALGDIKNWKRVFAFLQVLLLPGWFLDYFVYRLGRHKLEDLLTIIFTSGSTGEPKGVMLSHKNVMSNVDSVLTAVDLNPSDRALACLPFFHSFGYTVLLWGPTTIGASAVYYPDPRAAKEIGTLCKQYGCNLFLSTATFLRFYLKRCEDDDFRTLRLLVCGAEKLPQPLAEEFKERFGILPLEGYGCTELSPIAAANVPDRAVYGVAQSGGKPGTVGQALPGIAAKIVDPDTYEEVPLGHDGLVLIAGGNVMVGYLGKPEKTSEVIRDNWYVTGDMGHLDEEGHLTLTGRLSRFAKIGGEMVPLEKVEDELHAAMATADRFAAVTSVPDAAKGERLVVLYVAGQNIDPKTMSAKLAERNLPNLWLPKERDFFTIPELPLLGTGKLDLKKIKEVALEVTKKS